jgi:hypothetical protein
VGLSGVRSRDREDWSQEPNHGGRHKIEYASPFAAMQAVETGYNVYDVVEN